MLSFHSQSFLTFLVVSLYLCYVTADPEEDVGSGRQGKFFNSRFWDGFERGIKDTANMFTRVSDNLEVAFDQMANDFSDNLENFASKIERRVGGPLIPHYGREDLGLSPPEQAYDEDVLPSTDGGVDDGLEVFSPAEIGDPEDPDASATNSFTIPIPEEDSDSDSSYDYGIDAFNPFAPFGGNGGGIFNIFRRKKPWWQGQNVCVDREEIDDEESNAGVGVEVEAEVDTEVVETGKKNGPSFNFFSNLQMSSCRDTGERYTCVTSTNQRGLHKTVKVTYRCCHGFVRDGFGCTKIELLPMPETLEKLIDTSDFLSLVKAADMVDLLVGQNLTLFVPNNEAIAEYTADLEEKNEIQNSIDGARNNIYKRETHNLAPTLLSHMTEGFVYAGDLSDEKVLPSLNENSTIRVNVYGGYPPAVTVNCARIVTANQHSIHGVVHTIDRVIEPVRKSIADIVASDPQFSILKQLLSISGMVEEMRGEGQFTFLAPTDAAFRRLNPFVLEALMDGSSCLDALLRQHILPNTICSTAIQGKMKTLTKLDEYLIVERTEDDKLFVDDAQIVAKDLMATNGVLHIVDKALIPNEAKSVSEVLEYHNLTKFMELLELAELADEFDSQKDITLFAPTNKAIENIPEEELNLLKSDKEKLKEVLRYHMTTPTITARNINNNQLADTSSGHPLRINLYSSAPVLSGLFQVRNRRPMKVTAGCSRVSMLDSRACGAVVHIVEDMLEIPKSNILQALEDETFSIFRQMVHDTGMNKELEGEGPFTVLVPSDHAFKTLPEEELDEILKNEELKRKLVRSHIMQEHVCCSGINSNNWLFMDRKRNMDGANIHIRRSPSGRLMAGPARIIGCGSPASNGVVHTINRMVLNDRDINAMLGKKGNGIDMRIFPMHHLRNIFVA